MSTPKAKRGYRPLGVGDVVQAGDLVWFASKWQPVENFKDSVGKTIQAIDYRHCAPITKEAVSLNAGRSAS